MFKDMADFLNVIPATASFLCPALSSGCWMWEQLSQKHTRITTLTRQVKAVISELSLLHASSLRLTEEKRDLVRILTAAQNREEAGEPPTDDVETLWERCEFARQNFGDLRRQVPDLYLFLTMFWGTSMFCKHVKAMGQSSSLGLRYAVQLVYPVEQRPQHLIDVYRVEEQMD
jgi:hypothetical protein